MFRKTKSFVCLREASRVLGEKPHDSIGETHGDRYGVHVRGLVVADEDSRKVERGYETHVLCGDNCGIGAVVTYSGRLEKGHSYLISGTPVIKDNEGVMEIKLSNLTAS